MNDFIQYLHHGALVWVRERLKGRHKEHCLCYSCKRFSPTMPGINCVVAQELYQLNVRHHLVTPVWECAHFVLRKKERIEEINFEELTINGVDMTQKDLTRILATKAIDFPRYKRLRGKLFLKEAAR